MSNMSHCRFSNTLGDLLDCQENVGELLTEDDSSSSELSAAKRIREVCEQYIQEYDSYQNQIFKFKNLNILSPKVSDTVTPSYSKLLEICFKLLIMESQLTKKELL